MKAIEDGVIVESLVVHIGDDETIPDAGPVTVSLTRFEAEREVLMQRGDVGLRVESTQTAEDVCPWLADVGRIALEFPSFNDGRPYSTARLLREKFGYAGELRAVGDVLRDQIFYMQRCGFDAFEIPADKDPSDVVRGLEDFSVTYQTAADGRLPVYRTE